MAKDKYPRYTINLGKTPEGKRITKTFYGKTKKEAKQKAEVFRNQKEEEPATLTLSACTNKYLKNITDSTKEFRIKAFTDRIGNMPLSKINPEDIEAVLRLFPDLSQRTLTRYLQALNQVFTYALKNRLITFNPCAFVSLPTVKPPTERKALELRYIPIIERSDNIGTLPALIMIYCGLRRGELAALTWADVNFDEMTITVNKSFDYKNMKLKGTKSKAGLRTVPIPAPLLSRLIEASSGKKKTDLIINREGRLYTEQNWRTALKALQRETGITNVTWHCFRHTYATLLYSADVGVKEAQVLLGHSSAKVTMDIYTHLDHQKKLSAAEKINAFADNLQTISDTSLEM